MAVTVKTAPATTIPVKPLFKNGKENIKVSMGGLPKGYPYGEDCTLDEYKNLQLFITEEDFFIPVTAEHKMRVQAAKTEIEVEQICRSYRLSALENFA